MNRIDVNNEIQAATDFQRSGRLAEAEAIYRRVLARDPNHHETLHHLGLLAAQVGNAECAADLISRAASISANPCRWTDLGEVLHACGRLQEALGAYREALQLAPSFAKAWNGLGNALLASGEAEPAISAYREALRLEPGYPAAQINLAGAYESAGRLTEAAAAQRAALRLTPNSAAAHFRLGNVLARDGQLNESLEAFREARRIDLLDAKICEHLATVLLKLGNLEESIQCFLETIRLDPGNTPAVSQLGQALQSAGRWGEAIGAFGEVVRLRPNDSAAHYSLGQALQAVARTDEAIEACVAALQLDPNNGAAHNILGNCFKDHGRLDTAVECYRRAMELKADTAAVHSNIIYCLNFHPRHDAKSILAEERQWNQQHTAPSSRRNSTYENDPDPNRRLRIGYVSPDFRRHVVGFNVLPLFREHDHKQFEIFCYFNHLSADSVTAEIRSRADGWRNIWGVEDDRVEEMIRTDRIDILVDLSLHMANNRLPLFTRKPAPIQVTFGGYPGGTGLDAMDYRLTDRYLDPDDGNDEKYSERSIRLPHSFWCYDRAAMMSGINPAPIVNTLPALTAGSLTFGCLNEFCKINAPVLQLWAKVLERAPGSRLLMMAPEGSSRQVVLDLFREAGVGPERVEFTARALRSHYFEHYHRIDIGLDTFPYGGHTTALDSFWMGIPVVTLIGQTAVGRAGWSHANNLGIPELAADTHEQYVEIAVSLANDLPRLSVLRQSLRESVENSPLGDAKGFAQGVEAAYRKIWRRWRSRTSRTQ